MSAKGKDAEIFNLGAILPNVPGQEYVFGRTRTQGNPKEHFILCPFPNVEIRHCKISVDNEGEFWIEDLSSNSAKTSINREPLQGKKKLNFGDKISLQGIESTAFVYFEFEEERQVRLMTLTSTKGKDAEIFNLGAILPSIPGQEYIIGNTDNPGMPANPGEYFIPCCFPNVEARHCKILVDEDGEFWIENLDETAQTCINRKYLDEKMKLNFGDIISFEEESSSAFAYLEFKERRRETKSQTLPLLGGIGVLAPFPPIASEVGRNHVPVKNILQHFSVLELKQYRFVSNAWNSAASQLLRKRCAASIPASKQYERTKLFRCAKEMETFASTMTSLSVEIPNFPLNPDGEKDAEKFVEDLIKYQLKDSLTYFKISASELPDERLPFLDTVLQTVSQSCPNLEHVVFNVWVDESEDFALPNSNWTFGPNLKILEVFYWCYGPEFAGSILTKMDTSILEKFMSRMFCGRHFLPAMAEKNFQNLKEISLTYFSEEDLTALANLPSNVRLQKLVLNERDGDGSDAVSLTQGFSDVFARFQQTLVSLTMDCRGENIVLPSFENLEVLNLVYDGNTRLTLPPHFLYSTHYPKLKSLTLKSSMIGSLVRVVATMSSYCYTKAEALAQWVLNQGLFNSFITNGQVCSSLLELDIPHCLPGLEEENKEYEDRLREMRTLFPNVKGKWIKAGKMWESRAKSSSLLSSYCTVV